MKDSYRNYGHFSEDGSEFVITRPDTPRPWLNYLSNDIYGICMSQTGGGFSMYKPPNGHRITYHGRDDQPGKYVYLRDNASGACWSVGWMPVKAKHEKFECRHGLGYSAISSVVGGIEASLRVFVPLDEPAEIWTITVANRGRRRRELSMFPFVEWQLQGYALPWDTYIWYLRSWFDRRRGALIARLNDALHPGRDYQAFMKPDFRAHGFECRRGAFLGPYGSLASPQAVTNDACGNKGSVNEEAVGVLRHRFALEPGGSRTFNIVIGFSTQDHARNMRRTVRKFDSPPRIERELDRVRKHWREVTEHTVFETPDKEFDLWANARVKYQLYQTYRWCRGVGAWLALAVGFRDVMQDAMGMAYLDPRKTREALLEALRYQYKNGFALRQYSEVGAHDFRKYTDNHIWIIYALTAYLRETGDFRILRRRVPFFDGPAGTVLEHAKRALEFSCRNTGGHGLCLIYEGDWNDGLTHVGRGGRGESVWMTMAAVAALKEMKALAEHLGEGRLARKWTREAAKFERAIDRHGWDGAWYRRAYDDDGEPLGSRKSRGARIFSITQSWAVLAGLPNRERLRRAMESLEKKLRLPFGYLSHTPGFKGHTEGVGSLSVLYPRQWNYIHLNAFKFAADLLAGRGDRALETLKMVMPLNPGLPASGEPYAIPNFYGADPSDADKYGKSLYAWFSGSSAWFYRFMVEGMLGARGSYEGLVVDPCIPARWKRCRIVRTFRGDRYDIAIRNPKGVQRGVKELTVDGVKQSSNTVRPFGDGELHKVEVLMG